MQSLFQLCHFVIILKKAATGNTSKRLGVASSNKTLFADAEI